MRDIRRGTHLEVSAVTLISSSMGKKDVVSNNVWFSGRISRLAK